ncbi:VOC family protein [Quadrisphaera granulorum]|uniref:VOC family protein n=1 Tax=Quadrisphaera granulorum TaxID=317664 RepID=UPI0014733BB1|nr:VOC family protein [Quadrisphaera granulorum]
MIGHFDVLGPELGPLAAFYGSVFGWEVSSRGPGYAQVSTPGRGGASGLRGAITEAPDASLTLGVVVADLAAALARAEAAGGSVAMPATDNGWVTRAQVRDPAGNLLTLIQQ